MKMSNQAYNVIKYVITIFLPAVGSLYFVLAETWDFPRIGGVNGTINALITFGGILIGYSSRQYNRNAGAPDGALIVQKDAFDGVTHLGLDIHADSVNAFTADKDKVTLQVVDKTVTDPRMQAPVIPGAAPVNPATQPPTTPPSA